MSQRKQQTDAVLCIPVLRAVVMNLLNWQKYMYIGFDRHIYKAQGGEDEMSRLISENLTVI